jgi:L-seryl-tRNA(Ser) seleniumtransferase
MSSPSPRALPAIERLVGALGSPPGPLPRPLVVEHARRLVAELRAAGLAPAFDDAVGQLRRRLDALARTRLQPVVNATGILAHTNLGRAPLGSAAADALSAVARGYSNLEFDLATGERGPRAGYLESALALACEAPAATVVNNCAAALVLILRHLTAETRKEVVISRGELVQIGGGFRIPDILETSGARLREVGTTNRTTLADYREALGPGTALVLRVHRSNFFMEGFVESPSTPDLAALARERHLPLVEDLGSGALVDLSTVAPVVREPQPQEVLRAGADLVCFSGDKLLGGPQAGIVAGRADLVAALKKDPFFRALRCDKLVFAALQATVDAYLAAAARRDQGPPTDVPVLDLMRVSAETLRTRAAVLMDAWRELPVDVDLGESQARIGGGVCPKSTIPSVTLRLRPHRMSVDTLAARLRTGQPPVVAFVADDRVQLDLRTVFPAQDVLLRTALPAALTPTP